MPNLKILRAELAWSSEKAVSDLLTELGRTGAVRIEHPRGEARRIWAR